MGPAKLARIESAAEDVRRLVEELREVRWAQAEEALDRPFSSSGSIEIDRLLVELGTST